MKQLFLTLGMAFIIMLGGCTTFDPYTGEEKTTNTVKGAGIGAVVGGGVGYYMDTQEAKLRKQLRSTGVSVVRDGDNINLVMPGNITFPTSKSSLKTDFYPVLDSVALVLEEFEKTVIVVSGYTDSVGTDASNQQLSENRAETVADYLKGKGITAVRFDTVGFGERNPVADNNTEEGRALNRRVEITLLPITEES